MALFGRRERGEHRQGDVHYRMREKLLAIGDDYWIEDDAGQRVFKVNGKAPRIRDTLVFEDASGNELLKIQQRLLHIRDTMEIEDTHGDTVATVKKALITPLRDRFEVHVENAPDMEVHGNVAHHEYRIERGGEKVAEVSKKWFRLADTYGVEIDPTQDA